MFYVCQVCHNAVNEIYDRWVLALKDDKKRSEIRGHKACIDSFEKQVQHIRNEHKGKRNITLESIFKALNIDLSDYPALPDMKLDEWKSLKREYL